MSDDWPAIERVLGGDPEAFGALVERYAAPLFGFVGNLLPRHDAEDVVQEVLLTAYGRLASYDRSKGRFSTWLFTIARRKSIDSLRRRRPVDDRGSEALAERGVAGTAELDAHRNELYRRLDAALARLPDDQRNAFVLAEIQGRSYAEVAAIEDVPVGTVKSRVARARDKLRALLPHVSERRS